LFSGLRIDTLSERGMVVVKVQEEPGPNINDWVQQKPDWVKDQVNNQNVA
jgi:hypothetical protein